MLIHLIIDLTWDEPGFWNSTHFRGDLRFDLLGTTILVPPFVVWSRSISLWVKAVVRGHDLRSLQPPEEGAPLPAGLGPGGFQASDELWAMEDVSKILKI